MVCKIFPCTELNFRASDTHKCMHTDTQRKRIEPITQAVNTWHLLSPLLTRDQHWWSEHYLPGSAIKLHTPHGANSLLLCVNASASYVSACALWRDVWGLARAFTLIHIWLLMQHDSYSLRASTLVLRQTFGNWQVLFSKMRKKSLVVTVAPSVLCWSKMVTRNVLIT